jgi:group II intron reverse transcriptase/maturase
LLSLASPSFSLLYSLDEITNSELTLKILGHQWYWCAPSNDIEIWSFKQALFGLFNRSKVAHLSDAKRLMGPKHVGKGLIRGNHLLEKLARTKSDMIITENLREVHTLQHVDGYKHVLILHNQKTNMCYEKRGLASLQQIENKFRSKSLADLFNRNSGLPKTKNCYGNGGFILVSRNYSFANKGNQPKFSTKTLADSMSSLESVTRVENLSEIGIEPWIGKYSSLFNGTLYKIAYNRVKSKPENMIPGIYKETLDNIFLEWIDQIISNMKSRKYQCKPAVRKFIAKLYGKCRLLGIPTFNDKVVLEAIRLIIEPLFEKKFLDSSHGFRPNRSPHTALKQIRTWSGITWMIEGDIKGFFNSIDYHILAELLKKEIKDPNLIDIYWKLVNAGYVSDGRKKPYFTVGLLSPLLSNIYLHEFDKYMESLTKKFTIKGTISKANTYYEKIIRAAKKLSLRKNFNPSRIRVYYTRFTDNWVIGVIGNKELAIKIKTLVEEFLLNKLKIQLNAKKIKITHMRTERVFFLGTEIKKQKFRIAMMAPIERLILKLQNQKYCDQMGNPKAINKWIYLTAVEIIRRYNVVLRGILNYYSFVDNRNMFQRIVWILKFSACFTFSRKWNISSAKVFKKLGSQLTVKDENGKALTRFDVPTNLARTPSKCTFSAKNNCDFTLF